MLTNEQFTRCVSAYIDTVFRLSLNYMKNSADAEDVTQNVFEKLLKEQKTFESDDHIRYWLIRVTINECRKMLRSVWRRAENIEDYASKLSFTTPEHSELFYAVMELPQKYRVPIYLYYYEEYSTEQIGTMLKIPQATVCTQLKRGRELLRKILQEADRDV
ncbi:MAG: sigma-70 family RNA polymerase sigma factor [Oscillospiraceae bacterium]|nr:sigma-70 family RNA polymerase sigma factor [Oscillospiraceae bacterium]